jgi:hypothetical protein
MSYIQHRVTAAAGPVNIDITIELTFFEIRSLTERERMDANHDKTISSDEIAAYLGQIAESLHKGIRLSVAGRAVDLAPLYEPEIDLLLVKRVVPCHHVLLLYYFARTPEWLAPGDEIEIEDNLWPAAEALCSFEIAGKGGFAFGAAADGGRTSAASRPNGPWTMRARCVAAPGRGVRGGCEVNASKTVAARAAAAPLGKIRTSLFTGHGPLAGVFWVAVLMVVGAVGVIRRRRKTRETGDDAAIHTTQD